MMIGDHHTRNKMDDEVLKKLQKVELSILVDFDIFCKQHNIRYYLSCGTLLGAVRHKGFIPWDDDVDIEMPYLEYLKFRKIASKLPEKYFFQDFQTDPNWYRPHAKIRLKNTTMMEKGLTGYDINQGIWIDIFILIGVRNKVDYRLKKGLITASNYLQIDNYMHNSYAEFEKKLGKIGLSFLRLVHRIPMKRRVTLHKWILGIICKDNRKYKYTSLLWSNITRMYPSSIFAKKPVYLVFEGYKFPCAADWDTELKINYGDYMTLPPVEDRQIHYASIIDFENSYERYMTISKKRDAFK